MHAILSLPKFLVRPPALCRKMTALAAVGTVLLAFTAGFARAQSLPGPQWPVRPPAPVQPTPPTANSVASGTNGAVTVTMERVPTTNPDYFRQNQFNTIPDLASGAPGNWSVVSLGNSAGNQPLAGGPLSALGDGLAPASEAGMAGASVFSGTGNYGLLFDLGSVLPVTSITTYSAGPAGNGAGQNWQVWGSTTFLDIVDGQDPYATGWTRLAIGSPFTVWGDLVTQGGAFGIHLTPTWGGALGDFRYILFGMQDTGVAGMQGAQAQMAEISVGVIPEPAAWSVIAGTLSLGCALLRRRRGGLDRVSGADRLVSV